MQRQITLDQCHCSFGDGIVYEFVQNDCFTNLNDCLLCALWQASCPFEDRIKCLSVPCQKERRKDKNGGFWRISETVDYQAFEKMLENGG